mmetsp:Transcript_4823/g.9416  ORF Transcript_4823/g.9416 Transcript_4823/m.9416 type:complete len:167 (+) Transcript_4823:216-716(+)
MPLQLLTVPSAMPSGSVSILGKRKPYNYHVPGFRKLPTNTSLFCVQQRIACLAQEGTADMFAVNQAVLLANARTCTLALPTWDRMHYRVCEYLLTRAAVLAEMPNEAASEESIRAQGFDGWCSHDGNTVFFFEPSTLLRLVDDDKRSGLMQASLVDMWNSRSRHDF